MGHLLHEVPERVGIAKVLDDGAPVPVGKAYVLRHGGQRLEVQAGFGEGGDTGSDLFKNAHSALNDGDSFLEIEALGSGVLQCIGREIPGAHKAIGAGQHEGHENQPELGRAVVAVLETQAERDGIANFRDFDDPVAAVEGGEEPSCPYRFFLHPAPLGQRCDLPGGLLGQAVRDELVALAVDVDALPGAVVVQNLHAHLGDGRAVHGDGCQPYGGEGIRNVHLASEDCGFETGHG